MQRGCAWVWELQASKWGHTTQWVWAEISRDPGLLRGSHNAEGAIWEKGTIAL